MIRRIPSRKVPTFFLEGLMSSFPLGYLRTFCPRKSKPCSTCVMTVFVGESSRPRSCRKRSTRGFATKPWLITSRRISERESRDSGSGKRCGSSQARALTWTTTLGGKLGGSAAPRFGFQARKPREGKSLAPFADNLARSVQTSSDNVVGESFGGEQHDLRSDHVTIR